jgi:hypothetical protein
VPLARLEAEALGYPNLDFAIVEHPFGGIADVALRGRIEVAWVQLDSWLASDQVRDAFPPADS